MASITAFKPHGLIRSPVEQELYHEAHITNVYTGIADPKEYKTVALMGTILYSNIFTTRENFVVTHEQPPNPTSSSRCDIIVKYLGNGFQGIRTLCFAECKRTKTSQTFSLELLENQAVKYCQSYLDYEKDIQFVYAATMAGAHIRLWKYWRDSNAFETFWGPSTPGDWGQYIDVGDEKAGRELEGYFDYMKRFPPTPHAGQTSSTYGNQASASDYVTSSGFQPTTPGFQPTALGYQVAFPGYIPGNYTTSNLNPSTTSSYSTTTPSAAPAGTYMYPFPAAQTESGF